ncbi:MAG: cyclic lactone autoinducer peptide [Oscillospiraceae bacterium]|nr:cyclic lactone autoinducer peptide [Oscillospiraceae bacterium]
MKKTILALIALIGRKSAEKAYSSASAHGTYQPVEPKAGKEILEQTRKAK